MSEHADDEFEGDATGLRVFALYPAAPALDNPLLEAVVAAEFDEIARVDDALVITHPSLLGATLDGDPAWGTTRISAVAVPDLALFSARPLDPASAIELPTGIGGALCIEEELPSEMRSTRRRAAFSRVLACIGPATGALAFAWERSATVTRADVRGAGQGFVGIRRRASDSDPAGMVVESLGLTAFELPDVWCHARGMDPELLEDEVGRHATGVLEETEFIADGDPVAVSDGSWFEASWAWGGDPERYIIDLIPDEAHRAE